MKIKKILKNNYKLFVGFILGTLISGFSVFAATIYLQGSSVGYDNTKSKTTKTNVQDALDELYSFRTGTADASKVLTGYTFTNKNDGVGISGSMPNRGAWTKTVSSTTATTGGAGYYSSVSCAKAANSGTFKPTSNGSAIDMGASNNYRYVDTTGVVSAAAVTRTRLWSGSSSGNISVNLSGYNFVYLKSNEGTYLFLQVNGSVGYMGRIGISGDGQWNDWGAARGYQATTSGITATTNTKAATENWNSSVIAITEVWGLKNLQ